MTNADITTGYSCGVQANTRNHRGYFVQDAMYQLIEIERSGWALICQDNAVCHYVDPDNLRPLGAS